MNVLGLESSSAVVGSDTVMVWGRNACEKLLRNLKAGPRDLLSFGLRSREPWDRVRWYLSASVDALPASEELELLALRLLLCVRLMSTSGANL